MHRCLTLAVLLAATAAAAKPPRLTLFVTVDALGSDLLQRSRPRLRAGLGRLLAEGAYFPTVRYQHAECATASGHATLVTGANPARHGVVGNQLVAADTGKTLPVFADAAYPVLDAPLAVEDSSPQALLAETLADRLRASTLQRGKAIAISGKARTSIALAGRLGRAYWFHERVGRFVTGTYYEKELPLWLRALNDKKLADQAHGKPWTLLLPPKEYTGDDDRPFEGALLGMGRVFPHPLTGGLPSPGPHSYTALATSPVGNELILEAAKAALAGEALGQDDVPDLLLVSFSSVDRVHHVFGPTSWEMQDALLRIDKSLDELLRAAERAAGGRNNLVVILTADHGGAYLPEAWAALGLDGARISPQTLTQGLAQALEAQFKSPGLVQGMAETDVHLDQRLIDAKRLDGPAVRRAAAAWLSKQPSVALAVARDDLSAAASSDSLAAALRAGFYPGRSGDVLVVLRPFRVLDAESSGTSHGSPWSYDTEVPLLLAGRGVRAGVYPAPATAIDVAPTVAALMELGNPASSEGRALAEALSLPR